jgi:hypothetical protein
MVVFEAPGAEELFEEICRRDLFSPAMRERAMRSVDGGWYCWPEGTRGSPRSEHDAR